MPGDDGLGLPGLSVVCVFNDPAVREQCLDASLVAALRAGAGAGEVEYLPVDNVGHRFASAGAALNHGVRAARHEVVVFVHQDVHLHSVARLRELAAHLRGHRWGLIGACGVAADGTVVGALRDRVQLIGLDAHDPLEVDTVDEVLFMVRRDLVVEHPLSESSDLAWHAYAVEYSLRLRRLGLQTGAANSGITHHSMTVNLARLDAAHRHVADHYADQLPVRTTCGVVGPPDRGLRGLGVVRAHAWRRRWLVESGRALRVGRHVGSTVLADIRLDVDDLVWPPDRPLRVVNIDATGGFAGYAAAPVTLSRAGRWVRLECARTVEDAGAFLAAGTDEDSWLVTNLSASGVRRLTAPLTARGVATLLGVHEHDLWLLVGPVAKRSPTMWSHPRALPLLARA